MKPSSIVTITQNIDSEAKGKVEKKSGKRIGFNYIVLKSLKESKKNDVVKCLYIKSLTNIGTCVIKEGTQGETKDKYGRDIKDRLKWQKQLHIKLQDIVTMPHVLGSFEENGNYYLVLEHIRGKSLHAILRERKDIREALCSGDPSGIVFTDYLIQIVKILDILHQHQIVHRDVTASNFMIQPNGKVAVIDLELSYSLKLNTPSPPFTLGTYGYMSPEQEITQTPTIKEDVFSLGAIMLQVWTGISPLKITNGPIEFLSKRVEFYIPDQAISNLVIQCLQPVPDHRPTIENVNNTLLQFRQDNLAKRRRTASNAYYYSKNAILQTVQEVIGTLSTPLLADSEKGWFSENKQIPKSLDKNTISKAWYTSFSSGFCGVLYLLSKAHKVGMDITATEQCIDKGIKLVEMKYIDRLEQTIPSLHFGASGIAASLATALNEGLIKSQMQYEIWINSLLNRENSSHNFCFGMAGQGMAHWLCEPYIEQVEEKLNRYVIDLLQRQENDGAWIRATTSGKKRITRGFNHGVSGIIYFLLEYANRYHHSEALEGAIKGLKWLMRKSLHKKNNSITWRSSTNKEIEPWWSEGAPGIALPFLKAFELSGESLYKDYAIGALRNWPQHVIHNNISQLQGLSGLGEVYLEASRILKEEEWMERASWIAQAIMHMKKIHKDHGPYWLVEHERQPVADFMTGNSGVLHYLLRYCYPEKMGFPLLG